MQGSLRRRWAAMAFGWLVVVGGCAGGKQQARVAAEPAAPAEVRVPAEEQVPRDAGAEPDAPAWSEADAGAVRRPDAAASKPEVHPAELPFLRRKPPETPKAVQEEQQRLKKGFYPLGELGSPDFLAQVMLRRVLPPAFLREHRDQLRNLRLEGSFLDQDEKQYLLFANSGALDCALVVLDKRGRALDRLRIQNRMSVSLKDVLGDDKYEVIVGRIEGSGMSTWPETWIIYRVDGRGKLRKVLEHPKDYTYGSKFTHWVFLNRFDFSTHGRVRIETVHSQCDPSEPDSCLGQFGPIPPLGEVHELEYDRARRRFVPLPAP